MCILLVNKINIHFMARSICKYVSFLASILFVIVGCDSEGPGLPEDVSPIRIDSAAVQRIAFESPLMIESNRQSFEIQGDKALFGLTRFQWVNGAWVEGEVLSVASEPGEPIEYPTRYLTDGERALVVVEYWDPVLERTYRTRFFSAGSAGESSPVSGSGANGVSKTVLAVGGNVYWRTASSDTWSKATWQRPDRHWAGAVLADGTVIVRSSQDARALWIYRVEGGVMVSQQHLQAEFGITSNRSIDGSASGDRLVVAGPGGFEVFDRGEEGYQRSGSWRHTPDPNRSQQYGYDVEVSGDVVAVGAPTSVPRYTTVPVPDDMGSVYLYTVVDGAWIEVLDLAREDWISDASFQRFGEDVGLGEGTLIFGNMNEVIGLTWTLH